jgi:putative membrane protein
VCSNTRPEVDLHGGTSDPPPVIAVEQLIGMFIRILIRLAILAAAIGLTEWLLPGVTVNGGLLTYVWIAVVFALVNLIIGPLIRLVTLPLNVVTLGLFALIVNAALLAITAGLTDDFGIDGFWTAVLAAALVSVFSTVLTLLLPDRR